MSNHFAILIYDKIKRNQIKILNSLNKSMHFAVKLANNLFDRLGSSVWYRSCQETQMLEVFVLGEAQEV